MKRQLSLKLFISLSFLLIAVVLVVGYSFLSLHYYHRGMDTITATEMERAVRQFLAENHGRGPQHTLTYHGYQLGNNWQQMPPELQSAFGSGEPKRGFSIKAVATRWYQPPDLVYFLFNYDNKGQNIYISSRGSREMAPPIIGDNIKKSLLLLLAIATSLALVLTGLVLLLARRISRPVTALGNWARTLNSQNLSEPAPDFSYPELNEFAELVRTSLSSVQTSLAREQSFLRHASHELRTPIAVIRSNVELLHKIEENPTPQSTQILAQVIKRIGRAGLNMQHLTETLLWLSRKQVEKLPDKVFQLDQLLTELVDEVRYLLNRKEITLTLETEPITVQLPEYPVRIVLGNLIRNSFQHTQEGEICISQKGRKVTISNPELPEGDESQELGFGLGLQLTTQLTAKLGWDYTDGSSGSTHRVSINFGGLE